MVIIENEILDIGEEPKDLLEKEDVENINGDNIFLAIIEPTRFATRDVIEFCEEQLTNENLKALLDSSLDQMRKTDINIYFGALEDIERRGLENVINDLRLEYFARLESKKEKREIVTSPSLAFLAQINGQIYDFIDSSYIDLKEYYINYLEPFSKYFKNDEWEFEYFKPQKLIKLAFDEDKVWIIDVFFDQMAEKIDKDAKQKLIIQNGGSRSWGH